jgi:hypothetical protein
MTAGIPEDKLLPFVRRHSPLGRLGRQCELDAAVVSWPAPEVGDRQQVDAGRRDVSRRRAVGS